VGARGRILHGSFLGGANNLGVPAPRGGLQDGGGSNIVRETREAGEGFKIVGGFRGEATPEQPSPWRREAKQHRKRPVELAPPQGADRGGPEFEVGRCRGDGGQDRQGRRGAVPGRRAHRQLCHCVVGVPESGRDGPMILFGVVQDQPKGLASDSWVVMSGPGEGIEAGGKGGEPVQQVEHVACDVPAVIRQSSHEQGAELGSHGGKADEKKGADMSALRLRHGIKHRRCRSDSQQLNQVIQSGRVDGVGTQDPRDMGGRDKPGMNLPEHCGRGVVPHEREDPRETPLRHDTVRRLLDHGSPRPDFHRHLHHVLGVPGEAVFS